MFLAASWVGWTESLQSFTGMSFFLMTDSANDVVIYWKLHFCRICSLDHEAGIIALMGGCWHSRLNTTGTEVCLAYNNPLVWPWCSGTWGVTAILQNYLVHTCIFRLDLFTLWKYKRLRSLSGSLTAWGLVHCRLRHWILAYASQTFWKGCASRSLSHRHQSTWQTRDQQSYEDDVPTSCPRPSLMGIDVGSRTVNTIAITAGYAVGRCAVMTVYDQSVV